MCLRRIIFIAQHSEDNLVVIKRSVANLQVQGRSKSCNNGVLEDLVHVCWLEENFEHALSLEAEWHQLQTLDVEKGFGLRCPAGANNEISRPTQAADHLHSLADLLPYAGCMVEVVFVRPNFDPDSDRSMAVIGACMRLQKWHGAQVTLLVPLKREANKCCQLLRTTFHPDIQYSEEQVSLKTSLWRGIVLIPAEKVSMHSQVSVVCHDHGQLLKKLNSLTALHRGHCLTEANEEGSGIKTTPVLGPVLEVLACVGLHTVPLFLMDSLTFLVHVKENSPFGALMRSLSYVDGLVARLAVFDPSLVPPAAAQGLSTSAWREAMSGSGSYNTEMTGLPSSRHLFLVIRGGQKEDNHYTAHILRSPSEISDSLFEDLHRLIYLPHENRKTTPDMAEETANEVQEFLDDLPVLSAELFQDVDSAWRSTGLENVKLKRTELSSFIQQAQDLLLEQAAGRWKDIFQSEPYSPQTQAYCDVGCDPSQWPERLQLAQEESKKKVLSRYQSSDSVTASSSPLFVDESSMDAKDMVKWFRPDGSAVSSTFSPLMAIISQRRLSNKEATMLPWPECKDVHYHDVFYEHNKRTERQEHFFKKFRDVIMMEESHSSFDDHPHIPALKRRPAKLLGAQYREHRKTRRGKERSLSAVSAGMDISEGSMHKKDKSHFSRTRSKSEAFLADGQRWTTPVWPQSNRGLPHVGRPDHFHRTLCSSINRVTNVSHAKDMNICTSSSLPPLRKVSQAAETVNIFTTTGCSHSSGGGCEGQGKSQRQELRSQRHQRKLEEVVARVLEEVGVRPSDLIFSSCFQKLLQVTKFYAKQLPNAKNLKEEMRAIALKQVEQVVDLEKRRQDLAMKKKLRPSTILSQ